MRPLASYLHDILPDAVDYETLAELCKRVFCTTAGLPGEAVAVLLDKEEIAKNFAELAKTRGIEEHPLGASGHGAAFHNAHEKGHWLEVMASILKMGNSYDAEKTEKLLGLEQNKRST